MHVRVVVGFGSSLTGRTQLAGCAIRGIPLIAPLPTISLGPHFTPSSSFQLVASCQVPEYHRRCRLQSLQLQMAILAHESRAMRYIFECPEWHVLRALGECIHEKKSKFMRQPVLSSNSPLDSQRREYSAKLFEVELLSLFRPNDGSRVLSAPEFEECARALKTVCCHLDTLVHPTIRVLGPSPQGQISSYPHLQRLIDLLADSKQIYDTVGGSNTSIFKLPENIEELQRSLALVTQLNNLLARLLTLPNSVSASDSPPATTKYEEGYWEGSWLRDRAIATFAALTKHSNCGKTHDQLLKLPYMPDNINTKPRAVVDVLVSSCSNNWLALQCVRDFFL